MTLERKKQKEQVEIADNLEQIIADYKKALRKQKTRETLMYIFGGAIIAAETGLLLYVIVR